MKEAQAAVMKTETMLEKANAEYDMKKTLYEKGHISEFDLLTLKTTLKSAEADLLSAEAKLIQAENNLAHTLIRSPISGTVIERSVDTGQTSFWVLGISSPASKKPLKTTQSTASRPLSYLERH